MAEVHLDRRDITLGRTVARSTVLGLPDQRCHGRRLRLRHSGRHQTFDEERGVEGDRGQAEGAKVHTLDQRLVEAGPVLGVPTQMLA